VHVTEATCFLDACIRYTGPGMPAADQDRYFADDGAGRGGARRRSDPAQPIRGAGLVEAMRPRLRSDARTREVARLVLARRAPHAVAEPLQALTMQVSIDLLPAWARRMHGLRTPALGRPFVCAGTLGSPDAAVGVRVKGPSAGRVRLPQGEQ
jgi:uncharacterized protein (DUF2236 family)